MVRILKKTFDTLIHVTRLKKRSMLEGIFISSSRWGPKSVPGNQKPFFIDCDNLYRDGISKWNRVLSDPINLTP